MKSRCRAFLSAFLVVALVMPTVLWAQTARTVVPLAYDASRVYLAAELWFEEYSAPALIQVQNWDALTAGPTKAIARYFLLAKQDASTDIVELYFETDGSRDRLREFLTENPLFFEAFESLETMTPLDHAQWGNYELFRLRLNGGGNSAETGTDLFCDVFGCLLTDWIEADPIGANVAGPLKLVALIAKSLSLNTTMVQESVSRMRQAGNEHALLPPLFDTQGMNRPIILLADLLQIREPSIDLGEAPPDDLPASIRFLIDSLQGLRSAAPEGLDMLVAQKWTAGTEDNLIAMASVVQKADEGGVVIDEATEIRSYTWEAFKARAETWASVKVLGYAPLENQVFVFFRPVLASGKTEAVQLFTTQYDDAEMDFKLVSDSDQSLAWTIIKEPVFRDFIEARYGAAASASP